VGIGAGGREEEGGRGRGRGGVVGEGGMGMEWVGGCQGHIFLPSGNRKRAEGGGEWRGEWAGGGEGSNAVDVPGLRRGGLHLACPGLPGTFLGGLQTKEIMSRNGVGCNDRVWGLKSYT